MPGTTLTGTAPFLGEEGTGILEAVVTEEEDATLVVALGIVVGAGRCSWEDDVWDLSVPDG